MGKAPNKSINFAPSAPDTLTRAGYFQRQRERMVEVKFRIHPGTGPESTSWEHAPLDKFLLGAPLFTYEILAFGVVPPRHVLNERLALGTYDAGMGGACEWEPIEVSSNDYDELLLSLTTNAEHRIVVDEELNALSNYRKWRSALLSKYGKQSKGSR